MYEKLLSMLYALKFGTADVHYWVNGESFWGNHEFADFIRYGEDEDDRLLGDYIDQINEVCFLGSAQEAPYSKDIISESISYIPPKITDQTQMFVNLKSLIFQILSYIEEIIPSASAGEANLLGNIAQDLQQRFGLIWRRTK